MVRISRRSFVEKLGLGAGALILNPIAQTLVNEARGQTPGRKRAAFYVCGQNISPDGVFIPKDFAKGGRPVPPEGAQNFELREMHQPLAPFKNRMLLASGFPNPGTDTHTGAYVPLSCKINPGGHHSAGGMTFDQYLANKLSTGTRLKSVLCGVDSGRYGIKDLMGTSFASGFDRPELAFISPRLMFQSVFGGIAPPAAMAGGVDKATIRHRLIMDGIREDVRTLQANLAGPERQRLDQHLALLDDFDKRYKSLPPLSCKAPAETDLTSTKFFGNKVAVVEDFLEALNDMAVIAIACGITNIVGLSVGTGDSHSHFVTYRRIHKGTQFESVGFVDGYGHDTTGKQDPAMTLIHKFNLGLVAKLATALQGISEGNGTALDNSMLVYLPDNGEAHHSGKGNYCYTIVGNAGGKLKADGRYFKSTGRGACDLYSTLAHAMGAPIDDFGAGGRIAPKGPIAAMLT